MSENSASPLCAAAAPWERHHAGLYRFSMFSIFWHHRCRFHTAVALQIWILSFKCNLPHRLLAWVYINIFIWNLSISINVNKSPHPQTTQPGFAESAEVLVWSIGWFSTCFPYLLLIMIRDNVVSVVVLLWYTGLIPKKNNLKLPDDLQQITLTSLVVKMPRGESEIYHSNLVL